ncbi:MAG: hypothetical protein ABFS35_21420 [Bacteroidota bacterium]
MKNTADRKHNLYNLIIPSFAAMSFIIYPALVLFYPDAMLKDPGIGWHLISGHYIIDNKEFLNHDIFSFTRPGQEWTTYEWLFQCFAAGLEKIGGLPLLTAATALIYGSLPVLTYKRMIKEGSNIYIAVLLLFLTFFGLFGHCHARPHIFTYLFFILLLERIFSYEQRQITARSLFLFIPVMSLWSNLHGGFLAGIAVTGIAFLSYSGRFFYFRETDDKDRAKTYFLFGIALFLASLVNPFGWNLHLSILHYLRLDSLHMMAEYVSPNFNSPYSGEMVFKFLVLALFLLISRKKHQTSLFELILIIFFIYQSFHAVRHIFLFCLLAVPILSKELTQIVNKYDNLFTKRSRELASQQHKLKSDWIWIPIICITLVILSMTATGLFKKDLYGQHLTAGAGAYIEANIKKFSRPFNTENIGGALIYHFWPEIKIFGDDRNDFYGDDFYIDEYMEILLAKPKWQTILTKYDITSAIVSSQRLSTLMKASPDWCLTYENKKNTIFVLNKLEN